MHKTGIFGGSFDPVHYGHISLALAAKEEAGLDQVIFVPANLQPFKLEKKVTNGNHRYNMIKLAIKDCEGLSLSSFELDRQELSYTYSTLRHFRDIKDADDRIYFITGTDAFLKIDRWKNADEILSSYSFIIGSRPGYKEKEQGEKTAYIREKYGCDIIVVNNRQIDISSTELREKISAGLDISEYIASDVERYIKENGLYR